MLPGQQFERPGLGRWQLGAVSGHWGVLEALIVGIDADQGFGPVVVRFQFVVGEWPIEAETVPGARFEVVGSHPG